MSVNEKAKYTVKTQLVAILSVSFLAMFIMLFVVTNTSMRGMLDDRESESMKTEILMAGNMLLSSVSHLPSVSRDRAAWDETYAFMEGQNDGFVSEYATSYDFELFSINIIALVNNRGEVVYEDYYDYRGGNFISAPQDMDSVYRSLAKMTTAAFESYDQKGGDIVDSGVSGFVAHNGALYYLTSFPIIHSDGSGPVAGSHIFGRIINSDAVAALSADTGFDFSVEPAGGEGLASLGVVAEDGGGIKIVAEGNTAVVYENIEDIYGNESVTIYLTRNRTLHESGSTSIMLTMVVLAICCVAAMLILNTLIGRVVSRPLGRLSWELRRIDAAELDGSVRVDHTNVELEELSSSISDMLTRIKSDSDVIRNNNKKLYESANFDPLTGLHNRQSIKAVLESALREATGVGAGVTVFFFDIDRFKYVNDSLGHLTGDRFIRVVADRVKASLGDGVSIARMDGDEFLVVAPGLGGRMETQLYADKLMGIFKEPFRVKERELLLTISAGSATFPQDGQNVETLINNAEVSMYRAKELGKGLYVFYQMEFHHTLQRKIYIENKLRRVVNDGCGEFSLVFQPKLNLKTGEIHSCEVLMRWNSDNGVIASNEFIPSAEETGLILPISWWLINECCRCGSIFRSLGMQQTLAINISAQVLVHEALIGVIEKAVKDNDFDVRLLDVEITESTLLNDMEQVNGVLKKLHEKGMDISVDDFGTGYSSLNYLHKLAVNRIKIDRSFISNVTEDEDSRAIVTAIMAMSRSLHMRVTAEGVEQQSQCEFLRTLDCDEIQGYYISKPLPLDDYISFIKKYKDGSNEK